MSDTYIHLADGSWEKRNTPASSATTPHFFSWGRVEKLLRKTDLNIKDEEAITHITVDDDGISIRISEKQ